MELFEDTLRRKETIDKLKRWGNLGFPGEMAFTLYDAYSFPLDLTKDVADERGFTLDTKTFEELMLKQKEEKQRLHKKGLIRSIKFTNSLLLLHLQILLDMMF